ncbi:efflux RND transporter periplasmic adaptor subunit [Hyphococcus flavus]|uniref:Efflux RND transporter periplasmic adaptor subunit n=1 Tax=Hyphococcus flavus TaxID=1866326 RepID=A0AAE9ZC38_9PROT|nr:efflux RND transporter periplasmic adaptor subunit [Hyphococcus flavus]WDI31984.1 efflux RND transporter periplasmic adaptor subunit [Hyphococcus flavus]
MKRKFVLGGGALLAVAATVAFVYGGHVGASTEEADAGAGAEAPQGPPPAPVAVAKAERRSLAPRADTPGAVVSTRDSLVAAATSGKIEWVAEVGAEVDEGAVIARIEQADAKFTRDDQAAAVRRLRARADYLDSLYQRYLGLEEAGESEASMDEMRSNRDEALQALAQAEVALQRAETNLERTIVRAPFAGRVVSQEVQIGEFANPGSQLIRLVDTHRLEVTARAPAGLTRNIKPGDAITVANGAENLDATVRAVVPVGDERSRMLEVRLELPEDTAWYIGSAVRVNLPSAAPRIVTAVPRDALILRADRISVYVIGEDNLAKRVDVELGAAEGGFIEVIGEVESGDNVVIRGGERLRDGQAVTMSQTPLIEPTA